MHLRAAQQSLAMIGIKRDKKQGRVVLLEDEIQTWRGVGHLQQWCCRGACAKRLFISSALGTSAATTHGSVQHYSQAPLESFAPG